MEIKLGEIADSAKKNLNNKAGDKIFYAMLGLLANMQETLNEMNDKLAQIEKPKPTNKELVDTLVSRGIDEKELKGKNKEFLLNKIEELEESNTEEFEKIEDLEIENKEE